MKIEFPFPVPNREDARYAVCPEYWRSVARQAQKVKVSKRFLRALLGDLK